MTLKYMLDAKIQKCYAFLHRQIEINLFGFKWRFDRISGVLGCQFDIRQLKNSKNTHSNNK